MMNARACSLSPAVWRNASESYVRPVLRGERGKAKRSRGHTEGTQKEGENENDRSINKIQ